MRRRGEDDMMEPMLPLEEAPPPAKSAKAISVTELNRRIKDKLEGAFTDVYVEGEVSDPKSYPSGHTYFTLKDAESQISAVLFKGDALGMKFELQHGLLVLARGRVSTYLKRGQIQFIAAEIQPKTAGSLQLAFEQLKAKLQAEGLFEAARKRPIPPFPERVGIVTSLQGAAIRDMLSVLQRRFDGLHIRIMPVAVQGDAAAPQIVQAIQDFNRHFPDTDVLLVGRGGGSLEDLWAFNMESVARAIAASDIPVISCVGHETDFTIADFVADLRAPTPSAAAELVVKNKLDLLRGLQDLNQRLPRSIGLLLRRLSDRLNYLSKSPFLQSPRRIYEEKARRIDELYARLGLALERAVAHAEKDLKAQVGKLNALSPTACLSRGYAIAFDAGGRALRDPKQVKPGDRVRVRLHQGEFQSEVKSTS